MDIKEPFTYTALTTTQFRLFHLAPDLRHKEDELVGYLETFTWQDHPPYEALSYVWGSDEKPHILNLINEKFDGLRQVPITVSLHNALRSIRPTTYVKRSLWIDAICINQQDNEEKNYQVRAMAHIYKQASCVLGYIGEAIDHIEEGALLIQSLNKFAKAHEDKSEIQVEQDDKDLPLDDYPGWIAARQLYTATWPTRTWVLQEAIWAKKLLLMMGVYEIESIPYVHLAMAACIRKLPSRTTLRLHSEAEGEGSIKSVIDLIQLRNYVRRGVAIDETITPLECFKNGITLGHTLIQARNTICKDPRDKVYALMGIADDGFSLGIQIDYSKSISEVYKEAAYLILKSLHGVDILCHASGPKAHDLPSWVPDWSTTKNLYPDSTDKFQAGRSTPFVFGCTPDRNKLLLKCIIVGRIEWLYPFENLDMEHDTFDIDLLAPFLLTTLKIAHTPKVQFKYKDAVESMGTALISNEMKERSADCFIWYAKFIRSAKMMREEQNEEIKAQLNAEKFPVNLIMEYWRNLRRTGSHSYSDRLLMTDTGYVGNTGSWARSGDMLIVAYGSNIPFVVRPAAEKEEWILIGPCYVEGFMQGEGFQDGKPKDQDAEKYIYLV